MADWEDEQENETPLSEFSLERQLEKEVGQKEKKEEKEVVDNGAEEEEKEAERERLLAASFGKEPQGEDPPLVEEIEEQAMLIAYTFVSDAIHGRLERHRTDATSLKFVHTSQPPPPPPPPPPPGACCSR